MLALGTLPALPLFVFGSVEAVQMASTWIRLHVGGGTFGLFAALVVRNHGCRLEMQWVHYVVAEGFASLWPEP